MTTCGEEFRDFGACRKTVTRVRGKRAARKPLAPHEKCITGARTCIERVFGHFKINHASATRYDQLAGSFLGMLVLASARYWLKFVHTDYYLEGAARILSPLSLAPSQSAHRRH